MSVISGNSGAVEHAGTDVAAVGKWSISSTADLQKYVASNTKSGTVTLDGNTDWSGSYEAKGHTPFKMPGEAFTFEGSIDGSKGASGTAIVDQVEITIDIEAGAIIAHTVTFSANGALTLGAQTAADATVPDAPTSIGTKVETALAIATPVFTAITDVRTVTITIRSDNNQFVTSDTSGEVRRNPGNIDADISISVYTNDFASLPAVNDIRAIKVFVDATTFWLFEWVKFGEISDMGADIEGAGNVEATLNCTMHGFTDVAGTPTEGKIVDPAVATFWP